MENGRSPRRYGGEEMAVVCPERGEEECLRLAKRIVGDLRSRPLQVGDREIPITCSVGIATWPQDAATAPELVSAADAAMNAAKRAGRDRAVASRHVGPVD